jgi:hypothetical protein
VMCAPPPLHLFLRRSDVRAPLLRLSPLVGEVGYAAAGWGETLRFINRTQ